MVILPHFTAVTTTPRAANRLFRRLCMTPPSLTAPPNKAIIPSRPPKALSLYRIEAGNLPYAAVAALGACMICSAGPSLPIGILVSETFRLFHRRPTMSSIHLHGLQTAREALSQIPGKVKDRRDGLIHNYLTICQE